MDPQTLFLIDAVLGYVMYLFYDWRKRYIKDRLGD